MDQILPCDFRCSDLCSAVQSSLSLFASLVMQSALIECESSSSHFSLVQRFMEEVRSHEAQIEDVKVKGSALKAQGSPEDKKMVDRWAGDLLKRYDDLNFVLEEKQVSQDLLI